MLEISQLACYGVLKTSQNQLAVVIVKIFDSCLFFYQNQVTKLESGLSPAFRYVYEPSVSIKDRLMRPYLPLANMGLYSLNRRHVMDIGISIINLKRSDDCLRVFIY